MSKIKLTKSSERSCCDSSKGSSCCTPQIQMEYTSDAEWVIGQVSTKVGPVQKISTTLSLHDKLGAWKVRWSINRMNYKINPGIYCVGEPDESSPVLVTANYKLSFDSLRKELAGVNAWIVALDTKGVNVWCAAGKGTFGTKELNTRINKVKLASIVSHKNIILPQLGAPGIIAHEVAKQTGFKVTYGPVRAEDVSKFLQEGLKADDSMRTVKFTFVDRLVLTPVELVSAMKPAIMFFGLLFILNSIGLTHFGGIELAGVLGAIFSGTVLTPVLLPYIPGRAFAFKGWILGVLWTSLLVMLNMGQLNMPISWLEIIALFFILPTISAFLAMNFTGCSTYTSFSGVKKEMQLAVPLMFVAVVAGGIFLIIDQIAKLV